MRMRSVPLWLLAALSSAGCGSPTAREHFDQDVAPILENTCLSSVCHGVRPDAEIAGEVIDWSFFHVRLTGQGTIADLEQAYETAKGRINTREHPELSTFLQKPLSASAGGDPHLGGSQFSSRRHSDYRTIASWVAEETGGGEGDEELTDEERLFGDTVLPNLASRQCMNQSCHGAVAPFTNFAPPVVINDEPRFSKENARSGATGPRTKTTPLTLGFSVPSTRARSASAQVTMACTAGSSAPSTKNMSLPPRWAMPPSSMGRVFRTKRDKRGSPPKNRCMRAA